LITLVAKIALVVVIPLVTLIAMVSVIANGHRWCLSALGSPAEYRRSAESAWALGCHVITNRKDLRGSMEELELRAQRTPRVKDFICGGDGRGPESVFFVTGGHVWWVYISLGDGRTRKMRVNK